MEPKVISSLLLQGDSSTITTEKQDYEVAEYGCLDEKNTPRLSILSSPVTCHVTTAPSAHWQGPCDGTQDEDNSTVPKCKVYVMVLFIQVAWEEDII